jgi:phosphoheptose isomerase
MHIDKLIEETSTNLEPINYFKFHNLNQETSQMIVKTFVDGGKVLVCGNGGSHSDAEHFAGELVNFFTRKHKALNVITLGKNSTVTSAWGNDHNFEDQFAREVQAYGNPNSLF